MAIIPSPTPMYPDALQRIDELLEKMNNQESPEINNHDFEHCYYCGGSLQDVTHISRCPEILRSQHLLPPVHSVESRLKALETELEKLKATFEEYTANYEYRITELEKEMSVVTHMTNVLRGDGRDD